MVYFVIFSKTIISSTFRVEFINKMRTEINKKRLLAGKLETQQCVDRGYWYYVTCNII